MLTQTQKSQKAIAKELGVSPSTVSFINVTGTWDNFQAARPAGKLLRGRINVKRESLTLAQKLERDLNKRPTVDYAFELQRLDIRISTVNVGLFALYNHWLFRILFGKTVQRALLKSVEKEKYVRN